MSILGASAAAQDEKNELSGMIGRIFISDQGITGPNAPTINPLVRSGKGLTFEVNYARRSLATPVFAVSGEVPAVFNLDEDLNSGGPVVPTSYKQIFVTPSARVNFFPRQRFRPGSVWVGALVFSARIRACSIVAPTPVAPRHPACSRAGWVWM